MQRHRPSEGALATNQKWFGRLLASKHMRVRPDAPRTPAYNLSLMAFGDSR